MAPFYPLYVRRSDGKPEVRTSKTAKELNQPTAEQLDTKPNTQGISDFYRLCLSGETKEVDWRRKLGGMLMREIGEKEHREKGYILANLPENYRLYEHVKCNYSEIDGKTQTTKKNHAGGGNERQDAYLYGYPQGRKKRYRSPAEFFPHLLWLVTDEAGDNNNCSCKFCSPEEVEAVEKPQPKTSSNPIRQDTSTRPQAVQAYPVTKVAAAMPAPTRRPSQQDAQPAKAASVEPTPLPRYRSMEQKEDGKFNNFFFRPGEIVWFDKGGQTWGIGVVIKREYGQGYEAQKQYRVHPISHPHARNQAIVTTHQGMRPFYSWSPPPYTNVGLRPSQGNGFHVYTFDTVKWEDVIHGKFSSSTEKGDADVDGSIMGVKAVETTYTPFDRIPTTQPALSNSTEYNGIYIGCEKIWVGEPIRIRNSGATTDIMILQSIIERPSPKDPSRGVITLIGDTYSYRVVQLEPDGVPTSDLHLPLRIREDTRIRNAITSKGPDARRRCTSYWRLLTKNTNLQLADVKGRWYETTSMFPHLSKSAFDTAAARGEVPDVGLMLNGTGDCNKELLDHAGVPSTRTHVPPFLKASRRETALRDMVPASVRISRGLDESREEAVAEPVLAEAQSRVQSQSRYPPPPSSMMMRGQGPAQDREESQSQSQYPYVAVPSLEESGGFDSYMTYDGDAPPPSAFEQQFEQTYYGGGGGGGVDHMQED